MKTKLRSYTGPHDRHYTIAETLNQNLKGRWFNSGGCLWHSIGIGRTRRQVKLSTIWFYPPSGRKASLGKFYVLTISGLTSENPEAHIIGSKEDGFDFSRLPITLRNRYRSQGRIRKGAE